MKPEKLLPGTACIWKGGVGFKDAFCVVIAPAEHGHGLSEHDTIYVVLMSMQGGVSIFQHCLGRKLHPIDHVHER